MAEHNIGVNVETDVKADEASKQLRILAGVTKILSPEMRRAATAFNALLRTTGVFNGSLGAIAGAGGAIALTKMALKAFTDAVDEARKALEDFAKTGEEITDENRGKSTKELPQLYRERETLQKQLKTQDELVMQAGNQLPSTKAGAAWDWLKGTNVGSMFGAESAKKDYEDLKAQRAQTKQQLASVDRMISRLETQQKKEENAEKTWLQGIINNAKTMLTEGEHEIASMIQQKQNELDEDAEIDKEDAQSMTLLKNAPMAVQDAIRNAGKAAPKDIPSILVSRRDDNIRNQLNSLDRLGGYTSNLVNAQASPELQEMKTQTLKLNQIVENTKKTSARYS